MPLPDPIFDQDGITLYCGDAMEIMSHLPACDAVITDPPYEETSLEWDHWPKGWPEACRSIAPQMWCFGSLRMFLQKIEEFGRWMLAQDIVWEKHNGSSLHNDRFRKVHEHALHFYHGPWESLPLTPPEISITEERAYSQLIRGKRPQHWGGVELGKGYEYDGRRLMRSVIPVRSCHGYATNETQKPEGIIAPLLRYSVKPGGLVLDPFAGSGTVLKVARDQGKCAIGIEKRRSQCNDIMQRLSQGVLALADPQRRSA